MKSRWSGLWRSSLVSNLFHRYVCYNTFCLWTGALQNIQNHIDAHQRLKSTCTSVSLMRVFARHSIGSQGPSVFSCSQGRLIWPQECAVWSKSSLDTSHFVGFAVPGYITCLVSFFHPGTEAVFTCPVDNLALTYYLMIHSHNIPIIFPSHWCMKHYTIIDYWGIGHDVMSTWEYQYLSRRSQGQYW